MAGMWRSVRVLLWKNWRVKQRESRLNRGRSGGQWLYPALLTDIVLPLGLLLLLVQKLCEYNAQLVTPNGDLMGMRATQEQQSTDVLQTQRRMMTQTDAITDLAEVKHEFATLLLAAVPLLLRKSNQSLAILQRKESQQFLQYLDNQYPAAEELGISSYVENTRIIPFDESATNEEADKLLLEFPKSSGLHIYAGLDVRRTSSASKNEISHPLELLTLFFQKRLRDPSEEAQDDQLTRFYAKELNFNSSIPMIFPNVLPFQMAVNMFIRHNFSVTNDIPSKFTMPSADIVCHTVDKMLEVAGLRWSDFPKKSPLGHSFEGCKVAMTKGEFSKQLQSFLWNLVVHAASEDELNNLSVAALPRRPATTVAGPLESNIVFYMAYLFLWPYVRLVRDIVGEKEKQLKEYLMIMGLPAMSLLVSWFLLYFLASGVVSLFGMWMLSDTMFAATTMGNWYFFMLLMAFATSMLLFGVAITPMFSQTRTAAACAPLLYLVLSAGTFVRLLVGEDLIASSESLALTIDVLDAISSPVVFMASLHDVLGFDAVTTAQRPVTWSTVANPCRLMALQSAGYLLLGWYLENVFPRTYGVQQKWYFVFQPSFWFPKGTDTAFPDDDDKNESVRLTEMSPDNFDERMDDTLREQPLREYLQHFQPSLFVQSLSKTYPNGKEALKNVSFGVRKGEIFGLLGPNGAGKSTTLSILCGMLSPSSGDAYVGGSISVASNPQAVRQSLSVCFQQNILFDELTVWEHLSLMCALKASLGIKTIAEETWRGKLQHFGLDEKRDALSKTLSGGQKRKLSLVLALLDSSRVVLLDEPTAGMDLKARLDTWDALKRAVSHRAVILTTHSMHEAQALCENIGIVADGKLKCCGSSLFLRNQFGVGYKLTVVHQDEDDENSHLSGVRRQAWADMLMTTLRKYVPNATIVSDNKWETRVQLNDGEEREFAELFKELEKMKQGKVIKRYAVAATDLEDVFVKVTEGEDVYYHAKDDVEDADTTESADDLRSAKDDGKTKAKLQWQPNGVDRKLLGWQHSISQLRALIIKRMKMSSRDKKALFAQYVWPLGFFAIIMAVLQHMASSGGSIEIVTTLQPAAEGTSFFVSSASEATDSVAAIVAQIEKSSHPIVFNKSATTEQEMLDAIAHDNATTYFAGVFVSSVSWEDSTLSSPGMAYSLYYNETVRRSLPVTLQWVAQAYCKARSIQENTPEIDTCDLVAKKGVFPIDIKIGGDEEISSDEDGDMLVDPDDAVNVVRRIMMAFYLLVTLSSIVSFYITPVVKEKENGLKRLQFEHIESTNASFIYWLSNFMFDYTAYVLAITVMIIILAVFAASLTEEILLAWFISLVLFGLTVIPFLYLWSLAFASHSSAQSIMSYVSMFQIMAASIVFALSMVPGLCVKVNTITYFLQVFPLYTFGITVLDIVTVSWAPMRRQCLKNSDSLDVMNPFAMLEGLDTHASVWDWDVSGSNWFAFAVSSILYTLLLLVLDQYQMYPTVVEHNMRRSLRRIQHWLPCWRSYGQYTEADQTGTTFDEESPNADMVRAIRVSKVFNPRKKTAGEAATDDNSEGAAAVLNESGQVVALNDVSFSVEKRDCVALLGVNGSGKSTMFEILTAGASPTSGRALIDSCDVTVEPQAASTKYGYCPQGNILFDEMTVREHLELFYRLRCCHRNGLLSEGAIIDALMKRLDLFPVEHTGAGHLSGGNKRRLMLALALLSDHTSLLLLDEPSAGVDVVARRLMWRVLYEKRQSHERTSCLFTTHSMEEAEAVCANAVVLFKGKVVWCGSIPDLKQRVSRGISISVRLNSAAIWDPEQLQFYTEQIRRSIKSRPSTSTRREALESSCLPLQELEDAWELCHGLLYHNGDAATSANSRQLGKNWLSGLRSRFGSDDTVPTACSVQTEEKVPANIPIVEFVQEWLVQEAFARLETQLFKNEITNRSGESVTSADLETARGSGSNTSAVYETSCTDKFGLAEVFALMEENKSRFNISQYSISELSLERVFEQFT